MMAEEAAGGERERAQETLEETDIAAARHALQALQALQAAPCKSPPARHPLQAAWPAAWPAAWL